MQFDNCSIHRCSKKAKFKGKCPKHYQQEYRAIDKMKYAYNTSKNNAKRRGKIFSLTFEEFKKFAVEVDYIGKKGIYQKSLHIDRIEEYLGYCTGNIQPMENGKNVKKFLDYHYGEKGMTFNTLTNKYELDDSCPF